MAIISSSGAHSSAQHASDALSLVPAQQQLSAPPSPGTQHSGGPATGANSAGTVQHAVYTNTKPTQPQLQQWRQRAERPPSPGSSATEDQTVPSLPGQSRLETLPTEILGIIRDFALQPGHSKGPYLKGMMNTSRRLETVVKERTLQTVGAAVQLERKLTGDLMHRALQLTSMTDVKEILVSAKEGLISRDRVDLLDIVAKNLNQLVSPEKRSLPNAEDLKALQEGVESVWHALKELKVSGGHKNMLKLRTIVALVSQLSKLWGNETVVGSDQSQFDVLMEMLADFRDIARDDKTARRDVVEAMAILTLPLGEIMERVATGGERLNRYLDEHGEALKRRLRQCKGEEDAKRAAVIWGSWKSLRPRAVVSDNVENDPFETAVEYRETEWNDLCSSSIVTRAEQIDHIYHHLSQLEDKDIANDVARTMDGMTALLREGARASVVVSEHAGEFFKDIGSDEERLTFVKSMTALVRSRKGFISLEAFNIASAVVGAIENAGKKKEGIAFLRKMAQRLFDPSDRRVAYAAFPESQASRVFSAVSEINEMMFSEFSPNVLREIERPDFSSISHPVMSEESKARLLAKQSEDFNKD